MENHVGIAVEAPLNLQELALNDNGMVKLEVDTFKGLQNLEKLYLNQNKLIELGTGLFADLQKLQVHHVSMTITISRHAKA